MIARYALLPAALCLCGCVMETAGPTQRDVKSIDLDASERVTVDLKMGAGNLRVDSGSEKLMRADFTYNVPSWKPYVRYSSAASHGRLTIEQPGNSRTHFGHMKNEWDLRFAKGVPMDFRVHFGAGEADLNLGGLDLRGVEVDMGVGQLHMDLRGTAKRNYEVRVRGGVGEAVVRVPGDVGVYGEVEGGIGEIKTPGMRREGRRFFNDAYERSKTTIHLDIRGGVGSIRVISD